MNIWTRDELLSIFADVFGGDDDGRESLPRRALDLAGDSLFRQTFRLAEQFIPDQDGPLKPKERKRRRILDAATELFLAQGYRKTSMDEVARRAGVAKGTVYLYFKNKTDLLLHAIALEKFRYLGGVIELLKSDIPPVDKLRRYLAAAYQLAGKMPLVSRLLSGDRELLVALEEYDADMGGGITELQVKFIARLVRRAAGSRRYSKQEIDDRARVLIGLLYASASMDDDRLRMGLSQRRFASVLAEMLVDGIAPADAQAIAGAVAVAGGKGV